MNFTRRIWGGTTKRPRSIIPIALNTQVADLPECLPTTEINADILYYGASGLLKLQVLPLNWRGQVNSILFTSKQGEKFVLTVRRVTARFAK